MKSAGKVSHHRLVIDLGSALDWLIVIGGDYDWLFENCLTMLIGLSYKQFSSIFKSFYENRANKLMYMVYSTANKQSQQKFLVGKKVISLIFEKIT